jgi:hypothetical protein
LRMNALPVAMATPPSIRNHRRRLAA